MKRSVFSPLTVLVALIFGASACQKANQQTNRELFDQFKDKNIAAYVKVATQTGMMDSTLAEVYADSLMNYFYAVDSTFVRLSGAESEQFIRNHSQQAISHCDSIFAGQAYMDTQER